MFQHFHLIIYLSELYKLFNTKTTTPYLTKHLVQIINPSGLPGGFNQSAALCRVFAIFYVMYIYLFHLLPWDNLLCSPHFLQLYQNKRNFWIIRGRIKSIRIVLYCDLTSLSSLIYIYIYDALHFELNHTTSGAQWFHLCPSSHFQSSNILDILKGSDRTCVLHCYRCTRHLPIHSIVGNILVDHK